MPSSIHNDTASSTFVGQHEKKPRDRSYRARIRLQTGNEGAVDRSLPNHRESTPDNKGKL